MKSTQTNPQNLSGSKRKTIGADKIKHRACSMSETDSRGKTNLCCCYVKDTDGRYVSPCYTPVEDCCSSSSSSSYSFSYR